MEFIFIIVVFHTGNRPRYRRTTIPTSFCGCQPANASKTSNGCRSGAGDLRWVKLIVSHFSRKYAGTYYVTELYLFIFAFANCCRSYRSLRLVHGIYFSPEKSTCIVPFLRRSTRRRFVYSDTETQLIHLRIKYDNTRYANTCRVIWRYGFWESIPEKSTIRFGEQLKKKKKTMACRMRVYVVSLFFQQSYEK